MKRLTILAFLAITTMICNAQESVLLRYKVKKGDNYDVRMTLKQEMGAAGGMNMDYSMKQSITKVEANSYDSSTSIKTVKVDMLQGGNVISYDSTKSDDELDMMGKQMKAQFAPFFTAKIYTTTNSRGEITKVDIEPQIPALNQFKDQSNNIIYPKEEVKVGSSWSEEKEVQGLKMKTTYTVSKITKDAVHIEISGTVSGMGTGKISGKANIDRDSGMPNSVAITSTINAGGSEIKVATTTAMNKV